MAAEPVPRVSYAPMVGTDLPHYRRIHHLTNSEQNGTLGFFTRIIRLGLTNTRADSHKALAVIRRELSPLQPEER